jgi:nitrite reductase/ring-hydroxylating ferredoxin subunit
VGKVVSNRRRKDLSKPITRSKVTIVSNRRILLARVEELPPGTTKKFTFEMNGKKTEAFLANFQGELLAFVNRCVHLPITLDLDDNDFFTCDGNLFVCKTHGSVYDPKAGKCVGGPGQGKSLESLPLVVEAGEIYLDRME